MKPVESAGRGWGPSAEQSHAFSLGAQRIAGLRPGRLDQAQRLVALGGPEDAGGVLFRDHPGRLQRRRGLRQLGNVASTGRTAAKIVVKWGLDIIKIKLRPSRRKTKTAA